MAWYQTAPAQWFAEVLIRGYDNLPLAQIHRRQDIAISQGERVTSYLYQNGHPMVLASDTPSSPTYAAQPGLSSFIELNHMAKIGISLADLLSAATLNNAQAYGLDADYGTVTEGKVANLLLLEKNPLTTIEAYNAIEKVILRGEVIERATLAAN
jgi:imidazolonepropionase-like amidohydrolase